MQPAVNRITMQLPRAPSATPSGAAYAIAAYTCWGVFPLYFKAVAAVPAPVVLCHRIIWSALFMALWVAVTGRLGAVREALRSKRVIGTLLASTLLIACNWLVYIASVAGGHVLEASLGYFINPLVNVAFGAIFLRERLSRRQAVAVALALSGVIVLAVGSRVIPTISLVLAGTFATYGMLRKRVAIDSAGGLLVETSMLLVPALAFLSLGGHASAVAATRGEVPWLLLIAAGPITALPLLWFANGARRLSMSLLGFFQYISPTLQLGCAVLLFGERFTPVHAVTFAFIWAGVALFLADSVARMRARPPRGA